MKRVLVTGANGFIGTAVCKRLRSEGFEVVAALRHRGKPFSLKDIRSVVVGRIDRQTDWTEAVEKTDIVVHLAARVHVTAEEKNKQIEDYRIVNVAGTKNLAESAARAGVKRLVFLSSIKVNGEENAVAYTERDDPSPEDAYGISKMEAERVLSTLADKSSMEIVVLRPPLVYGPGVKANFLALMRLVARKIPFPFGSVTNQRSFIYIDNMVDCIHRCMTHPAAAGQTYLVSDDRDFSTPELIRSLAFAMDTTARLFACPPTLLRALAMLVGKGSAAKRLLGSLTVDISKVKGELAWTPPIGVASGMLATARWFKEKQEH